MEAKIEKISELSKLLSVKNRMSDDLFHLFGKFGIGRLLSQLSLEKQDGVSASELILSLCLFRIVGDSIHSICKHKIYELSNHGKNCFYRMMIRPSMDWRRLITLPCVICACCGSMVKLLAPTSRHVSLLMTPCLRKVA